MPPASRTLVELLAQREYACRLTPDRALESLDEAEAFLRDRGMITTTACCSLPSLHAACHEEPYRAGGRGFAGYPKTKWWWTGALTERPGIRDLKIHRGKALLLPDETAAVLDPLCRLELARAEDGAYGDTAARLVTHLAQAGPTLLEAVKAELELDAKQLRAVRARLEPVAAVVSTGVVLEARDGGHRHSSELLRWDQVFPSPPRVRGGLEELVAAGVRAALVAPEREVRAWFSWAVAPETIERLVSEGRLARPEPGWVALA